MALAFLAFFGIACLAPAQSDTYWHLSAGQDFLRTGHIPRSDTYSHTVAGLPWPNHSWLWQVGAYLLHTIGGFPLLGFVNALLATLALVVSFRLGGSLSTRGVALLLLAIPLYAGGIALRPQVASGTPFAVLLWLVARQRYWWMPLLFLVWANTHAAVVMGGVVVLAALALALIDWLRMRTQAARDHVITLSVTAGLSALATLANPLGPGLLPYVLGSIRRSKFNGIEEWSSSLGLRWLNVVLWLWIGALVVAALTRWRSLDTWRARVVTVVALATAIPALAAQRNGALFVLAALPAVIHLTRRTTQLARADRSPVHTAVALAAGALAAVVVTALWTRPLPRMNWDPVPSAVIDAIRSCPGALYNTFDEGGYLIWAVPDVPVFVDNRQDPYPQELLVAHAEVERSGRYRELFQQHGIACAALPPDSPTASALVRDGWLSEARADGWIVLFHRAT